MTPVPPSKDAFAIVSMSAESTFRLPALIVPLETISPDVVTVVPVIAFAVKTEFAMFVIVALSPVRLVRVALSTDKVPVIATPLSFVSSLLVLSK